MKQIASKGITLIALVITIIVLLILAGISIAMLTGENGILTKAANAERETEIVEAKEQAKLDIAEWTATRLKEGKEANVTNTKIQEILEGKAYVGSTTTNKFTTKKNGYEILYSDLYSAITGGNETPGGSDTEDTATPGVTVTGKNKTYTKNGTAVIPVGFRIVEGLDDVSQGLVITDEEGNEFVWIPVTSESQYVRNTNYNETHVSQRVIDDTEYLPTGVEVPEGKTEGQVEKEMVVNAGGFYIARYEAGKEGIDTVVSKKGTVWNNISQTDAKEKARTFINNSHVKSALITGIQWDTTMGFVNGNLDGDGETFNVTVGSPIRCNGKTGETSAVSEKDKVCNIYSLEAGFYEYIAERDTRNQEESYIYRGDYNHAGDANTFHSASYRCFRDGKALGKIAFRLVLYVSV